MSLRQPSQNLELNELARQCGQETNNYYHQRESDPRFCFELFRRAIVEGNQLAWECVCTQYQPMVAGWVKQHRGFGASGEDIEYFVNGAFAKISRNLNAQKFSSFSDLGSLLRYLKMCVHSVITDFNRLAEQAHQYDESMEDMRVELRQPGTAVEEQVVDSTSNQALWDYLKEKLNDEKERLVVEGLFILDLKPREIYDRSPRVFRDVDEIYQVKQNVIARLRRDPGMRAFMGTDG
jgi:hypothetical protein